MPEQEMNRVQRRLWRAFMETGVDTSKAGAVERLHRLVQNEVATMSPALRHVMRVVLFQPGEVDYRQLAREIERHEGMHLSMASLRKRVWHAASRIERAIRHGIEPACFLP